ncbi:MAG: M23 family metallopeptidase [Candidatus Gracilibacteria bacterium]
MIVTRAYGTPTTHLNNDSYAIDFGLGGCDAFGKLVISAKTGVVSRINSNNSGIGYGNFVEIKNDDGTISMYAHLSEVLAYPNQPIKSLDTKIGRIGNTGNVEGVACTSHPGTHLHFATYGTDIKNCPKDKQAYNKCAVKSEPLSSCINIKKNDKLPNKEQCQELFAEKGKDKSSSAAEGVSGLVNDMKDNIEQTTERKVIKGLDKKTDEVSKDLEKKMEKEIDKKAQNCCVAEAAYASSTNSDLYVLRDFRDDVLKKDNAGRWIVSEYYRNSPPVAAYLSDHKAARDIMREMIVEPSVSIIRLLSK